MSRFVLSLQTSLLLIMMIIIISIILYIPQFSIAQQTYNYDNSKINDTTILNDTDILLHDFNNLKFSTYFKIGILKDNIGLEMKYPDNWEINSDYNFLNLTIKDEKNNLINNTRFIITSKPIEYGSLKDELMRGADFTVVSIVEPFKTRNINNITIGGLVFNYQDNIKGLRIGFIHDNTFYLISYLAPKSIFSKYFQSVKEVVGSMKISEFKTYENLDFGIKLKYGANWDVTEKMKQVNSFASSNENSTIFYLDKKNNNSYFNNLQISVFENLNNFSFNYLFEAYILQLKSDFNNYKMIKNNSIDDISIPESRHFLFSYNDVESNKTIYVLALLTMKYDKVYSIIYSNEKEKFYSYLPEIFESINSLQFINWLNYNDLDIEIKVKYPNHWDFTKKNSDLRSFNNETSITLFPYSDLFQNNINSYNYIESGLGIRIFSYHIKDDVTFNDLVAQIIGDYKTKNQIFPNFNLISSNTLIENKHQILNYTFVDSTFFNPLLIKCNESIFKTNEGKIYHISYCEKEEKYSSYLEVLKKLQSSLTMLNIYRYEKNLNDTNGIIFNYPSSWKILENSDHTNINFKDSSFPTVNVIITYNNQIKSIEDLQKNYTDMYIFNNLTISESKLMNFSSTEYVPIIFNKTHFTYSYYDDSYSYYDDSYSYYDDSDRQITIYGIHLYSTYKNYTYSIWYYTPAQSDLSIADNALNSINIIDPYQPSNTNFVTFDNSTVDFTIKKPEDWKVFNYTNNIISISDSNLFQLFKLDISILTSNEMGLNEIIKNHFSYNVIPYVGPNFKLIESSRIQGNDLDLHMLEYSDDTYHYFDTIIMFDDKTYAIASYYTLSEIYYNYLPIVKEIIKSIKIKDTIKSKTLTGFSISSTPSGIAYNPNTNKIYIADSSSDSISVIDGSNYKEIKKISVGKYPEPIAVDPSLNFIYVGNINSGSISVIDGSNNEKIRTIKVGPNPLSISVNSLTHKIYVADGQNNNVYVIDGPDDESPDVIPTGSGKNDLGIGIGINELTDLIYVANPVTNNITVIQGKTNKTLNNITIPFKNAGPIDIAINSFTNTAYVVLSTVGKILPIDLRQNTPLQSIDLGQSSLNLVSLNRITNMVYVGDYFTNSIIVIDPNNSNTIKRISVDPRPFYLSINENDNLIYVTGFDSGTMSIINGSNNQVMFRIGVHISTDIVNNNIFGINFPLNSTKDVSIYCNNKKLVNNSYMIYNIYTNLSCFAKSDALSYLNPIISSNWHGLDSIAPISFNVSEHGEIGGKFSDLGTLFLIISPIISFFVLISVIILSLIPSISEKIRHNKEFLFIDNRRKELLSKTEIIGLDASVIVGVLIFLTLSDGFEKSEQNQITMITAGVIFPFALSVIMAVTNRESFAGRLMLAGFINLMISVILIVIMKIWN